MQKVTEAPYGPGWEKEMMKLNKKQLINLLREAWKKQHKGKLKIIK